MGTVFGKLCTANGEQIEGQKVDLDFIQFNKQVKAYKAAVEKLVERINEERKEILQGEGVFSKEFLSLKVRFVSLFDQLRSEADILEETAQKSDEIWKSQMVGGSEEIQSIVERHKNQALRIQILCNESKDLLREIKSVRESEGV